MTPRIQAHLALLGTNLFFAVNYSAIKYFTANNYAGPFGLNIIRTGICLILFWVLFLFKPKKERISKKDMWAIFLCAFTAIAINQSLFLKGLSFTSPIHASLLTLIVPILITVLAAQILKEKLTTTKLIGLFLGLLGAMLLISAKEKVAPGDQIIFGDFLVMLSAIAYTFYFILVKPLMARYSPIMVTRWIFTFGFFMTLPLGFHEFNSIPWEVYTANDWFLLFMIVIPGTFFAYVFNVYGIKILSASTAGAYIYLQPVFAVIIAMVFLNEKLSGNKILAAFLIFGGVYLSNRKVKNKTGD